MEVYMKALRRFLTLAAVMIFAIASASAIDQSNFMYSECIGEASQEEFAETFEEITEDYFLSMLEMSLGNEASIEEFYQLTGDSCTDEEKDMISTVEDYLIEKEAIDNNEIYMVMAIRNVDVINSSMGVWLIFTHCADEVDFTHYAYFVNVSF